MTIKTPATFTPPPNAGEGGGDGKPLYRKWERSITNDGQGEVNFADAICDLTDPNSGFEVNVNVEATGVAPIPNFRALSSQGRKVHFAANFDSGLDTLNNVNCVFDGNLIAESRNASASSSNGSLSADLNLSSLSLQVAADGTNQTTIIIESKNFLKLPLSGITFLEAQGVFEHPLSTTNTTTFSIQMDNIGVALRDDWNIDKMDGTGPSEITLDFKKIQTFVAHISGKNKGDVKTGFLVNDTLYFAHVFYINNSSIHTETLTLNLPFVNSFSRLPGDFVVRRVGLSAFNIGSITFNSEMDVVNEPTLMVQNYLNNVSCYTVGADPVEKKVPFTAGNKDTFVEVTTANTPLFSIQCAPTFSGLANRTVFNIDRLDITASSQDENFGCYISVLYNTDLTTGTNPFFVSLPTNPESALQYDITADVVSGGIEIFSTYVMANKTSTFAMEDIFKNYRKEFSRNEIDSFGISTQVLNQTLTVVASPMQGKFPTTEIDVSANIFGGEVG